MDATSTIASLVVERPGRSRLLEKLGLDYCCGGKKPLGQACTELGLSTDDVIRDIAASDSAETAADTTNPADLSITALADHIEATHHAYLRAELPRISALATKVAAAHGTRHPETLEVQSVVEALRTELEAHLRKEETILFPMLRELDTAASVPHFHCGTVRNPVRVMEMEHDSAGSALAEMRRLTADYTLPQDGCNTYRALLDALTSLEADLHQHIHKENNILFPRGIALERKLAA